MPNWCQNNVTIKHKDPEMIDRAQAAFNIYTVAAMGSIWVLRRLYV